ncbi:MAG TPA: hypothetical protein VFW89_07300 [Gemmatimonadaceae bacterium]|nr:hypothetical protein [Gemmatimonadaceae bacterium]
MNGALLEQRLETMGIQARVESLGRMAVARVSDSAALANVTVRDAAVAAAAELGFLSLALELEDDDADRAPLPGR